MRVTRCTAMIAALVVVSSLIGTPSAFASSTHRHGAFKPRFVAGPCPPAVPVDPRVDCGIVTVLADRGDVDGGVIRLPVVIIRSRAAHRLPDPIVYLAGGPGGAALPTVGFFLSEDIGGPRDVIVFDQRGTGDAIPSLGCPEVKDAVWNALGSTDAPPVEATRLDAAFVACRARLVGNGVRLQDYTTETNADDVADVRVALGLRTWNLFGVSYGTTLALETMRRHPEGIRSVALDSVYPTTVENGGRALVRDASRVLEQLYKGCATSAVCAAKYPKLREDVAAVVGDLDAHPYHTLVTDPTTGLHHTLVLTGADIMAGLFDAFYDSSLIGAIPGVVELVHHHQFAILDALASQLVPALLNSQSEGMQESVNCADRQRLYHPDAAAQALRAHPEFSTLLQLSYAPICPTWRVRSLPEAFNDPVHSRIPTVVFGDQYDPITPPAQSEAAADSLARATFVAFPGLGHGAVFSGDPCPAGILEAFYADPDQPPAHGCTRAMGPPHWQ